MKRNFNLVEDLYKKNYRGNSFNKENSSNEFLYSNNHYQSEIYNNLMQFWKRLVARPSSYPQNQHLRISTILEEELGIQCSNLIKFILSRKLRLTEDSQELLQAIEACNQIFHEDYPGDFILEYNDERLGMMILANCGNSKNKFELEYKFNPGLKSFRGLM